MRMVYLALFSLFNCAQVNKQRVNKCAQQNAARDAMRDATAHNVGSV